MRHVPRFEPTTRLRPIVTRRGFAVGTAPRRVGVMFYVVIVLLSCGGIAVGTIAMADVVRAVARAS